MFRILAATTLLVLVTAIHAHAPWLTQVGAAKAGTLTVQPGRIVFPAQRMGTASAAQAITLKSSGDTPVAITAITLQDPDAAAFRLDASDCANRSLGVGATCTLRVVFAPTAARAFTAHVVILDNTAHHLHKVELQGAGKAPRIVLQVPAARVTFPAQKVGTRSAVQEITLKSSGDTPVAITAITLMDPDATAFAFNVSDCANRLLPAGATCTLRVVFAPTAARQFTAHIFILDNSVQRVHKVTLQGIGKAPRIVLSVFSATVIFPAQKVNTKSAVHTVALKS
jgi:hypothetical protein